VTDSSEKFPSDREAVERVHGLFLSHIDVIRGFIRALVRDTYLADDVLQETFLTVARKAESFTEGTNFPKWACAVARMKVLEARRRDAGRLSFLSVEVIEALAEAEELVEQDKKLDLIEDCIEELPPSMRKMVDMRYVSGRKPAEIARVVGWTVEAVYVALSRARSVLRECLEMRLAKQGGRP
jgi:RNA polymerase sigma-70 factor, ECF subfamily